MRDYSKIQPKFWDSEIVAAMEINNIDAAYVALYLMTSPASTMLGLFRCSAVQIADDSHLSVDRVELALSALERTGFLERDQRRKLVYVKKMAAVQIEKSLKSSDNRVIAIKKELDSLPDCELKHSFISDYNGAFSLGFSLDIEQLEAPSKPLLSPPTSQEQEQEQGARAVSKSSEQEQELRALRARAEEQKNNTKKVDAQGSQQSESESAAASQLPAAVAACTFENLDCESLALELAEAGTSDASLAKKAVSKREKSTKPSANGIDLSKLPPQISVMAAETLIAHRKAKRSPFVQVSFDRFMVKVLEASAELSISADDVIFEMIDAGWTGFRTDWLKNRLQSGQKTGGNSRQKFGAMSVSEKSAVRDRVKSGFLDSFVGVNPVDGTTLIEGVEYAKC